MSELTVVLVHSPLVGPLSWQAVADRLAAPGWQAVVPDLREALTDPAPLQPAIARTVAARVEQVTGPVVLAGHSGAGPLLPGIAAALAEPVRALLYVDAGLPHPGQSWWQTAPPELTAHLSRLAVDGQLPPWPEWFPPEVLTELVPDPQLRARFVAEPVSLPVAYFHEPMADAAWSGPAGYLLLSEAYRDQARQAAAQGMPVAEFSSDHLAVLTRPVEVADRLVELVARRGGEDG